MRLTLSVALLALLGARAAADTPRVSGFEIRGGIDPPGRLETYLATLIPPGSPFVEIGDADREGTPVSTIGRLRRALDRLGYHALIETRQKGAGELGLLIHLRAYDRVRYIFVKGNWPIRQDEIIRQISVRPGQPIPLVGPEREAFVDRERRSVLEYLQNQGYREAQVDLDIAAGPKIPAPVSITIKVHLGPPYPVGPVTVRGNEILPTQMFNEEVHHQDWRFLWLRAQPYKLSVIRGDLAALTERYRELGYAGAKLSLRPQIDVQAKNVRLQIDVSEKRRIEVAFEGNKRFSASTLVDEVTVFERGSYLDAEVESSANAVAQYYRERGHMLVKVTWRRERLSVESDRLIFTVDEGPRLKVRMVGFTGNRELASADLKSELNVKPFPTLGFIGLGEGGYTSVRQLELDTDNLEIYYRSLGFLDAKVRCEIAPAPGRWRPLGPVMGTAEAEWRVAHSIYVRFIIEEGVRVRIRSIRFERTDGVGPLPRDETFLRKSLLTMVGAPLQNSVVREDIDRLRRIFGDHGHPQVSVEPNITRREDAADIVWQVRLGPHVRVGPVFVRGNFLTTEQTLRLWLPLEPGSPLTTTAYQRGQRNLALIQLFNNATPVTFPGETPDDAVVPMVIEVEERHDHWGVLRAGGGVSTDQAGPDSNIPLGFYAAVGYEHRNAFGLGWTTTGRIDYGTGLTRTEANFLNPRYLGTLFRLESGASYLRQATVRLGDVRSGGGFVGFAREMFPGVDAALRYNLRQTYRTESLLRGAGPDEEQQSVQIGTPLGSLSFTLDWLRLDNPLVPTRGFRLHGGVELAHPAFSVNWGEDTFLKTTGRSLVVVPLGGWLSLRHSLRYDQGFPLGGASLLPKVERYFAGGDTTVRGFELDRARSEAIRSEIAPGVFSVQYRPVGGNMRVLHNMDLQVPIAPPVYGSVFFDSGVVADSPLGLRAEHFRHGAGLGMIVRLPVGDLSFSWAWPLDPLPGDSRIGRFHLNVGLMF